MFFKDWIESEQDLSIQNCIVVKFNEIPDAREKIYEKLVERVIEHYTNPKRVNKYLKDEKFSKLENYINKRIPTDPIHEKGDFGEIFGTEHLKQFHNYTFPILKLRHKHKTNKSLEGEDIIGLYIENGEITRVCVGEAKVRTNSDSNVLGEAIDQLEKSYTLHPTMIKFFSDRVYEIDEELGDKIEDLMSIEFFEQIKKDSWIFFITGYKPRKFNIKNNELNNLFLINVYFEDLDEFIPALFEDCRGYYHEK
ncbi:Hachiman antiphage defense system protein HamA [uncultured Methanobrevibacter sp.]|uniref:Hachiman antiphage defense system protein HamA n=1 Tax=uncultured Methanobrevibacter sp. TaxID=253161 RepID=UPI0026066BB8|nr:Hachiman antiphage defense system protein HamA [uncultured Methanobrevibacter sp.]